MNTEERQCMAEDREKGKREDALIEQMEEADKRIVERFIRGGFEGATFPSGQILTRNEHKAVCNHIDDLTKQLADLTKQNENYREIIQSWAEALSPQKVTE